MRSDARGSEAVAEVGGGRRMVGVVCVEEGTARTYPLGPSPPTGIGEVVIVPLADVAASRTELAGRGQCAAMTDGHVAIGERAIDGLADHRGHRDAALGGESP